MLLSLFAWLFSLGFKIRIAKNMSNLTLDYTYVKSFLLSYSFPNLITFLLIHSVIPATHIDVILNSFPCLKASRELCHILVIPISEIYSRYIFFLLQFCCYHPHSSPFILYLCFCISSDFFFCFHQSLRIIHAAVIS